LCEERRRYLIEDRPGFSLVTEALYVGSPHQTEKTVRLFESGCFHCPVFRSGLN
jgi:hypothetical protein